jgi:hypothetical protein
VLLRLLAPLCLGSALPFRTRHVAHSRRRGSEDGSQDTCFREICFG